MTTTTTRRDLEQEAEALALVEYCVQTNEGTYGATEAGSKVGTGDPRFANRKVYETVGGTRRETGPDEQRAPGRMRSINRDALSADRKRLADLRRQISKMN